ncbi:hypothetical protein SDJN02_00113, partial [Cucurbita argyrosperma subsp. argyrosperma]
MVEWGMGLLVQRRKLPSFPFLYLLCSQ